jgi:hypothetical protein
MLLNFAAAAAGYDADSGVHLVSKDTTQQSYSTTAVVVLRADCTSLPQDEHRLRRRVPPR